MKKGCHRNLKDLMPGLPAFVWKAPEVTSAVTCIKNKSFDLQAFSARLPPSNITFECIRTFSFCPIDCYQYTNSASEQFLCAWACILSLNCIFRVNCRYHPMILSHVFSTIIFSNKNLVPFIGESPGKSINIFPRRKVTYPYPV